MRQLGAEFFGTFWLVLGVVMVIVAGSTYFLSRYWAFKGKQP